MVNRHRTVQTPKTRRSISEQAELVWQYHVTDERKEDIVKNVMQHHGGS